MSTITTSTPECHAPEDWAVAILPKHPKISIILGGKRFRYKGLTLEQYTRLAERHRNRFINKLAFLAKQSKQFHTQDKPQSTTRIKVKVIATPPSKSKDGSIPHSKQSKRTITIHIFSFLKNVKSIKKWTIIVTLKAKFNHHIKPFFKDIEHTCKPSYYANRKRLESLKRRNRG